MSQTEDVVLALGKAVADLQTEINELRDAYISLQKGLANAFREIGFDFSKIGQVEPRRLPVVAQSALNPEALDPDLQHEAALKILKEQDQVTEGVKPVFIRQPENNYLTPEQDGKT
jgi:hypothetical protein